MNTTKQAVEALLNRLPEDCSLEDVQYHLYVIKKVRHGLEVTTTEGTITQEAVEVPFEQMGYRVVWSPKAVEDVESIAAYIAPDSVSYAAAVVEKILDVTRNLGKSPLSGRIVPEFGDESIREQFAYSYRIIYQVQDETVTLAAVIHGKKLLELDMKR